MDWLNYHHLYYFWILKQEGSFTKAALRLKVSQSSVSEQISLLEERCNTTLLDRSNRRQLHFTEAGLNVLDYANSIFETGQELVRWLKNPEHKSSKVVRIGIQSGMSRGVQIEFLRPILNKPEHKIEVVSGDQERLLRLLNDYKIDLILMSSALDERFSFQSYAHLLFTSSVCVVARSEMKMKEKDIKKVFSQYPLYLPSTSLEIRGQIDAYFERHKIKPNIAGEVDDIALLRLLALSTNSLVLIPEIGVERDVADKTLKVHHKFLDIKKFYYAITRQQKFPNPLSGYLIKSMKKE
jgi:LysR family transcriptional regulator, transcriptional activator of nhaA